MEIRPIDQADRTRIDAFLARRWNSLEMVVLDERVNLGTADGFFACEKDMITGLITFRLSESGMEILSLDSLREREGTGTALLAQAVLKAGHHGMKRIRLITTNDNLAALRFYQKRGFRLVRIDCSAVDRARSIKPEIPLIGMNGIPIKDEIELEMLL